MHKKGPKALTNLAVFQAPILGKNG